MSQFIAAFFISFVTVGLKATQQLNVLHNRVWWVLPCSLLMGLTEVSGVLLIVRAESLWMFLPLGLGGWAGCLLAMSLHKRLRNVSKSRHDQACENDAQGIEGDLCDEWR